MIKVQKKTSLIRNWNYLLFTQFFEKNFIQIFRSCEDNIFLVFLMLNSGVKKYVFTPFWFKKKHFR